MALETFNSISPAIPGPFSINSGVATPSRYNKLYNNPLFDYLGEQLPTNIKKLLQWCEHIYYNAPVISNAIKKYINYPLTDIVYESESETVQKETKNLLENVLKIRSHLADVGLDYFIYGNAFRSVYFPVEKYVYCTNYGCPHSVNPILAKKTVFKIRGSKVLFQCPSCKRFVTARLIEKDTNIFKDIRVIKWNPHLIDIKYNDVTGDCFYYYSVPGSIKTAIFSGDSEMILSTPLIFIDAVRANKQVKFGDNFMQLKTSALAGTYSGWGISPLAQALKIYLYMAILRKSNEAIALEQIIPKNILFPQGTTSDPALTTSMDKWNKMMTRSLELWRQDPNYTMLAPYPTGVVNIGSQGKGLLVNEHITEAEQTMVRALDVPVEFVYGTTNINNSSISLRILENQLVTYTTQMVDYVNWLIDSINNKYHSNYCHISFAPFKLSDDIMKWQTLVNLIGTGVSKTTYQTMLGLDPINENKQMQQDAINDAKQQQETNKKIEELQHSIVTETQDEINAQQNNTVPQYNQEAIISQADEIAMQLASVPEDQRDSMWAQLKNEDYILYAATKARSEELRQGMKSEAYSAAKANMQQQASQAPTQ